MAPLRLVTESLEDLCTSPYVPFAYSGLGRAIAAGCHLFERTTRHYGEPVFGIDRVKVGRKEVAVHEVSMVRKPFCELIHFRRDMAPGAPKVLVVAPLSGHYATLLKGTVAALAKEHDVYVTQWRNARDVPLRLGAFGLDDYIDYLMEFIRYLGPDLHVIAVCQPSVQLLAATALMAAAGEAGVPKTITLMGGPIDTRINPTKVNELAHSHPIEWFESHAINRVPAFYPGAMRHVYPGFLQLTGFLSMNLDRHIGAHMKLFNHLIEGDGDSADSHRAFYDEYMSVMDLPAEFYLETLKAVFMDHLLPKGEMTWRGQVVDPGAITKTALLTIEGELDDISGVGQTRAAHDLCVNLAAAKHAHSLQKGVGHYGIFNGRRWRERIMPRIAEFIRDHG